MKRLLLLLISFICVLSLVSCGVANVNISFSKDLSEVESVEIYKLEKEYIWGDVRDLREENIPVCTLKDDEARVLINEISSLDFTEERIYFPAPVDWVYLYRGYVVSVVYTDGSYDIIGDMGQLYYENCDGGRERYGHADYCGEEPWDEIIKRYIQE